MPIDWQDIAALGAVGLALTYLARSSVRALGMKKGGGAGCGSGCGSCPSRSDEKAGGEPDRIVTIGPPRR